MKEHSAARFAEQWARTRALLGDRVGLYQVHSLTVDGPLFADAGLLEALAGLSAEGVRGRVLHVRAGAGGRGRRAFELEAAGRPVFSSVQSTWNVLEPSVGGALAAGPRGGETGLLVKETLANGRLAWRRPAARATSPPRTAWSGRGRGGRGAGERLGRRGAGRSVEHCAAGREPGRPRFR